MSQISVNSYSTPFRITGAMPTLRGCFLPRSLSSRTYSIFDRIVQITWAGQARIVSIRWRRAGVATFQPGEPVPATRGVPGVVGDVLECRPRLPRSATGVDDDHAVGGGRFGDRLGQLTRVVGRRPVDDVVVPPVGVPRRGAALAVDDDGAPITLKGLGRTRSPCRSCGARWSRDRDAP